MESKKTELKRLINFHQTQIKKFDSTTKDSGFHRGAIMAFCKCEEIFKDWTSTEYIEYHPCRFPFERMEMYNELIMAVECKYANETRHQTALRFIKEAQNKKSCGKPVFFGGVDD